MPSSYVYCARPSSLPLSLSSHLFSTLSSYLLNSVSTSLCIPLSPILFHKVSILSEFILHLSMSFGLTNSFPSLYFYAYCPPSLPLICSLCLYMSLTLVLLSLYPFMFSPLSSVLPSLSPTISLPFYPSLLYVSLPLSVSLPFYL